MELRFTKAKNMQDYQKLRNFDYNIKTIKF